MSKHIVPIILSLLLTAPACAQDGLQSKGVSYWGQPAAQQLYTNPAPAAAPGRQPYTYQPGRSQRPAAQSNQTVRPAARPNNGNGNVTFEVVSHGVRREALVHVPPNYNPKNPRPLLLVFHGLGMEAYEMPILTLMNGPADQHDFVVVYPDAGNKQWDDGFTAQDKGDIAFIEDLLRSLPRTVNYDRSRVYACGISNGGFFCQRLACDLPEYIKGIAVISATGFAKVSGRCNSPSMPVMFFFGTSDPLIPYDASHNLIASGISEKLGLTSGDMQEISGGLTQMGGMYSGPQAVDYWIKRNGVSNSPRTQMIAHRNRDNCRVQFDDYGSGREEIAVYIVENGGHTWPGALAGAIMASHRLGTTTQDIDASELIVNFFASK